MLDPKGVALVDPWDFWGDGGLSKKVAAVATGVKETTEKSLETMGKVDKMNERFQGMFEDNGEKIQALNEGLADVSGEVARVGSDVNKG